MLAALIVVSAWAIWTLFANILALYFSPDVPLWFFYAAVLPSLLTGLAAYSLYKRSWWVSILLLLAIVVRVGTQIAFHNSSQPIIASSLAGELFERLPASLLVQVAAYLAISVYTMFLRKLGYLH